EPPESSPFQRGNAHPTNELHPPTRPTFQTHAYGEAMQTLGRSGQVPTTAAAPHTGEPVEGQRIGKGERLLPSPRALRRCCKATGSAARGGYLSRSGNDLRG